MNFKLGQKVKLIRNPPGHCPWPVGTTGVIEALPGTFALDFLDLLLGRRNDNYAVKPDVPSPTCRCKYMSAPGYCLAPIEYDGYEPFVKGTEFDFTEEEELETVS